MKNIITQTEVESKPIVLLLTPVTPAYHEAQALAARWPQCKERAYRAADHVDSGKVWRIGQNTYHVQDMDAQEVHTVVFATFNQTGGYSCDCSDWWRGLVSVDGAPYPFDWSGCSPMCTHVLAVDLGLRAEAVEDEEIPW